jgi:hypothetical protein
MTSPPGRTPCLATLAGLLSEAILRGAMMAAWVLFVVFVLLEVII